MRRIVFVLCLAAALVSCNKGGKTEEGGQNEPSVTDPVEVTFPEPTEQIPAVVLNAAQKGYVSQGNKMAFRLLKQMYEGKDMICSPLSLQIALAMTANGASGETLQEIVDFLGYGADGIDALNSYCKTILEQLPAVDLDVKLKLADAILGSMKYSFQSGFKSTVQSNYYAAVENMSFDDPEAVCKRINEWASRNTDGFIKNVLDPSDISPLTVACLMNALYFKAKWQGTQADPMFLPESTMDAQFTLTGGKKKNIPMMNAVHQHGFAKMEGYSVLALPYAGGKFFMYILLPDTNNVQGLIDKLPSIDWNTVVSSLNNGVDVVERIPKFDIEEKYQLKDALMALGIQRAFSDDAQFDKMFVADAAKTTFCIGKVIQKAKISVAEWGTEAAAVTVVQMYDKGIAPGGEEVNFICDHPFVFLIGEATSGAILFQGVFTGE